MASKTRVMASLSKHRRQHQLLTMRLDTLPRSRSLKASFLVDYKFHDRLLFLNISGYYGRCPDRELKYNFAFPSPPKLVEHILHTSSMWAHCESCLLKHIMLFSIVCFGVLCGADGPSELLFCLVLSLARTQGLCAQES